MHKSFTLLVLIRGIYRKWFFVDKQVYERGYYLWKSIGHKVHLGLRRYSNNTTWYSTGFTVLAGAELPSFCPWFGFLSPPTSTDLTYNHNARFWYKQESKGEEKVKTLSEIWLSEDCLYTSHGMVCPEATTAHEWLKWMHSDVGCSLTLNHEIAPVLINL